MFPERVEWSFLDPEYSFVAVWWILPTRFTKKSSPNQEPTRFTKYFQLGLWTNIHRIKNGLKEKQKKKKREKNKRKVKNRYSVILSSSHPCHVILAVIKTYFITGIKPGAQCEEIEAPTPNSVAITMEGTDVANDVVTFLFSSSGSTLLQTRLMTSMRA